MTSSVPSWYLTTVRLHDPQVCGALPVTPSGVNSALLAWLCTLVQAPEVSSHLSRGAATVPGGCAAAADEDADADAPVGVLSATRRSGSVVFVSAGRFSSSLARCAINLEFLSGSFSTASSMRALHSGVWLTPCLGSPSASARHAGQPSVRPYRARSADVI